MRALRRPSGTALAALVVAGLAIGCLGRSPAVSFYTMGSPSEPNTAESSDGLAIGVGPIRVPRYLDRPEWITRPKGSTGRIEVDAYRHWAGGFATNVASALGENLAVKLATPRVIVYPSPTPYPLDYRIALDFQAFEAIAGQALVMRVNWVIREGSPGSDPWSGRFATRRSIAGGDPEAIVAAHNEALELLADAVAQRIERVAADKAAVAEAKPEPQP